VPELIDPSVAELSPNLYNAARISGLSPQQAKFFNQMSKQYKKGLDLTRLGEAAARREFLELEPTVQDNIRLFFPNNKAFAPEEGLIKEVLSFVLAGPKAGLSLLASPFMKALEALEGWEKGVKTPYPTIRQQQEAEKAQRLGLPVTKRGDFSSGIIKDIYDGKNNWKWDKVTAYEDRYGVAITTVARAMAEGRTPGEAIELYGNPDDPEIMQAIVFMYDQPEKFNQIKEGLKIDAQISPGRDITSKFGFIGKIQDGNYWTGVAQRLLGVEPRVVLPKGVILESPEGQEIARAAEIKVRQKVSGTIDGFYTIFGDPLTYIGLGLPAVGKLVSKGVGGLEVGVREAFKMSAFKTKGQRLAEQFKFVSDRKGTEEGYNWLFNEPEVKTLWDDQLGPRLKAYAEAKSPTAKASVLESIKFDFPEWYNDSVIKTLTSGEVKAFDADSAKQFFTKVDDSYLMLNGRVNGISYRRNGIPYARKTRTLTSAMHRVAYSIFNPTSEVDIATKEILDKGDAEAKKYMTILTKVADEENKLLNPEIDDLFAIQQDVGKARRLAYKLGTSASRVPGLIRFGENAIETADNLRNTASLVLPKNIANAVTLMLLDEPLDVQLTAVRNMQYAFMKRLNVPEEDIVEILKKTYNEQAGFSAAPDLPIADNIASQMHPMSVTINNGQAQLAATGAIQPSQLTKAVKQLPFDMIYQLSARANLDKLNKATPAKNLLKLFNGFSRSTFMRNWNNNWAAYTLAPRLGIRTNVDEGFFYLLTKPVVDILDMVASKFQKDIKGMQAVTGSSEAIGPWKGSVYYIANKRGWTKDGAPWDPRKVLSPGERAELAESVRKGLSDEVGYEVPMSEVQPLLIKETILSRIEDVLKVNGEEWENWKRLFRNNSNFTDSLTAAMGARDLVVGKIDRDFYDSIFDVDQLTLFIKELGLERSPLYTPKEVSKLNELELGLAQWDNFVLRFGFNQMKIIGKDYLNPVDVFFKNDGLRNDDFFGAMRPNNNFANARQDLMEQMGATYNEATGMYLILDPKKLQAALSEWSETVYLRQKNVSDPEIARIYSERILNDMRFAFHGSATGFNQNLFDLMKAKHADVIKAGTRQGKPMFNAWSRAANNLTWEEFDDATVGFRPASGYVNTRLVSGGKVSDLDALKEDLGTIDKWVERFPDKVLEMMDRQVTGFFRLPAMRVAVNKAFTELKPYEKMLYDRHYRGLLEANPSMNKDLAAKLAEEAADKAVTNIAVNMATNSVLEFVDNPAIRSNFVLSIRHLGRFARATEDFQRRVYRLYANEGPRYLARMRLLHYGLENFGSVYEDEKGEEYITFPTDIVMNTALQRALSLFNIDYKVGAFNDFSLKFRLINPSFSPDAGQPAFAGPLAGVAIAGLKFLLRDLPVISAFLPEKWEDAVYPWTTEAANYLDMFAMGHIGRNTEMGEAIRMAFPMLATTAWDALVPAGDKNRIKANYVLQSISYAEAFGNGIPDFASNKEKTRWLNNQKTGASNIAVAQSMMGMLSPAYPQLRDAKGLPDFIKENGIGTWSSAFWDIYQGVIKSDPDVANPFELAVAMFTGKNPGKAVYTIPKTTKEYRVLIAKTDEVKNWAENNKRFIKNFEESGIAYVFAPTAGEYNPDMYNFLESQGLIDRVDFQDYLQKVQIATDKEKYFAIDEALNKKLVDTVDYNERSKLIAQANYEQSALLISNPELEDALDNNVSKGELRIMMRDLRGAIDDPNSPISKDTRVAMRFAIDQVQSFIDYSDNPVYRQDYNFSNNRQYMKRDVLAILGELAFDPAVKEAVRLVFVPLLNNYSREALGASIEGATASGR